MKTLLTKIKDLNGKTITEARQIRKDYMALHLDDGTVFVICSAVWGDDEGSELEIPTRLDYLLPWQLYELGFIDKDESVRIAAEQQAENERSSEARDRANYERLKARFDPPSSSHGEAV